MESLHWRPAQKLVALAGSSEVINRSYVLHLKRKLFYLSIGGNDPNAVNDNKDQLLWTIDSPNVGHWRSAKCLEQKYLRSKSFGQKSCDSGNSNIEGTKSVNCDQKHAFKISEEFFWATLENNVRNGFIQEEAASTLLSLSPVYCTRNDELCTYSGSNSCYVKKFLRIFPSQPKDFSERLLLTETMFSWNIAFLPHKLRDGLSAVIIKLSLLFIDLSTYLLIFCLFPCAERNKKDSASSTWDWEFIQDERLLQEHWAIRRDGREGGGGEESPERSLFRLRFFERLHIISKSQSITQRDIAAVWDPR